MELIIIGILGLCIGSFLNVCIYRIPLGQSIIHPPSSCTSCRKRIPSLYLMPLIGYIVLGGKCFNCKGKISIQYPIIELIGAALAVGIYIYANTIIEALIFYNLFMVFLAITLIDIDSMIIPDEFIIYLIITALPYIIYSRSYGNLLVGLGLGFVFLVIAAISGGGMGGGDVKLAFVIGLYLGFPLGLLGVFLGFLSGGVFGLGLLLKGNSRKKAMPFGPFLALGTDIA